MDVTDDESIRAAALVADDVTLLVNNAGVATGQNLVTGDLAKIRLEMDTHSWGTLAVVRAFVPVLAADHGGAILNVLSALSWFSYDGATSYAAAKAAEWSLTNGIRLGRGPRSARVRWSDARPIGPGSQFHLMERRPHHRVHSHRAANPGRRSSHESTPTRSCSRLTGPQRRAKPPDFDVWGNTRRGEIWEWLVRR